MICIYQKKTVPLQRICSVFYEKNFKKIEYKVVQMSALE